MRYFTLLFILLFAVFSGCKTTNPLTDAGETKLGDTKTKTVDFYDQSTWLLGYFNMARLKNEPYASWFYKGYDEYSFNTDAINNLLDISKDDISIKIVMGTWCPDSRREVPRFMKVLDTWKFPQEKVTFIGVDIDKKSPVGEFDQLDIQRVPTFIIYKNNIEAGRIIENPTTSLEQDMVNILTKN